MKKLLLGFLMSLMLVANSFAVNVPSGYNVVDSDSGITTYKNSQGFYVINAPYGKFGIDLSSIGRDTGLNKHFVEIYKRETVKTHWLDSGQPYTTLNGQFFGSYLSDSGVLSGALSMQTKGDNTVLQVRNLESGFAQKSLYMYKGVLPLFVQGYSTGLLKHSKITDAISAFSPDSYNVVDIKIKATQSIGRHYIGCIVRREYSSALSTCNNILFFYSQKATHNQMMNEIAKWGVQSKYVMIMDGSGSAQLYSENLKLNGYDGDKYDDRIIPNALSIYVR